MRGEGLPWNTELGDEGKKGESFIRDSLQDQMSLSSSKPQIPGENQRIKRQTFVHKSLVL